MKKLILISISIMAFTLFFAGVMRDDVDEAKYISLGAEKQFECVGRVFNGDKAAGSCVLVGNHYVLSAAHVFMQYTFRQDTLMMGGQKVIANVPVTATPGDITTYRFEIGGKSYKGKAISVHADYTWKNQQKDMALIELDNDVSGVAPATLNPSFDELGADITGVGFGASGYAGKPQTVTQNNKKIGGENVVDSIGGPLLNNRPTTLICDFDSPANPALNRIGSAMPRPLEYICSGGDSGGGMFRKKNGKWELVGICHNAEAGMSTLLKNGYYGLLMEWTRVSIFTPWIKQTMNIK